MLKYIIFKSETNKNTTLFFVELLVGTWLPYILNHLIPQLFMRVWHHYWCFVLFRFVYFSLFLFFFFVIFHYKIIGQVFRQKRQRNKRYVLELPTQTLVFTPDNHGAQTYFLILQLITDDRNLWGLFSLERLYSSK